GPVHLLLEHAFVDRADRVLRSAEDLRPRSPRLAEGELRDGTADPPLDSLRAERDLVVPRALPPFIRAVCVADRHPHDGDRRMDPADGNDARDSPPGAHDHLPADLLAQDPVRRADVADALGRNGRGLEGEPVLDDRPRRLVDDAVLRRPSALQREIEFTERKPDADDIWLE